MTLDGQINIANKLRGGMCAAAGGKVWWFVDILP
jgi:hypothetical protein